MTALLSRNPSISKILPDQEPSPHEENRLSPNDILRMQEEGLERFRPFQTPLISLSPGSDPDREGGLPRVENLVSIYPPTP